MRIRLAWLSVAAALLAACTGVSDTRITDVADLPVKSPEVPSLEWKNSPLRANAMYVFHDANTNSQRKEMVGDYYYVNWDDAEPDKPVKLVMLYTQAGTGIDVKRREVSLPAGRERAASRQTEFFFNGPERQRKGDIMSWRVELYVDGQLKDARQSYLWQ
ncbi:MAG: hypothetical protein IKV82_02515 [Akkermansia sp.]|nr:hypothetical protein [Akkermansia sp.]